MKVVYDTSILIDHLRNFKQATDTIIKARSGEITGYISALSEAELFAGRDSADDKKRLLVAELISLFIKVNVDNDIARKAGEFRRKYNVPLSDCIIAATAAVQKVRLWTKNVEDFRPIKEIVVEEPY